MRKIPFLVLCAGVSCHSLSHAAPKPPTRTVDRGDQHRAATALREFAAALTQGDLAKASSRVAGAQAGATHAPLSRALRTARISYSVRDLRIALNQQSDVATVTFHFGVDKLGARTTHECWAVLRPGAQGWQIHPADTLRLSGGLDPFQRFISLISGQRLEGEEQDSESSGGRSFKGTKFSRIGFAVGTAVSLSGRFTVDPARLRNSLVPYDPTIDVLLRDESGRPANVSFNRNLANVALKAVRNPRRTVMLYEGKNGQLDFGKDGRSTVVLADWTVRYVDRARAKSLLVWRP